jgi:hypothetical protein
MHSKNMRTLSMCIVTYFIEYLSEFEFIFETILDYESGDQISSFDAKKPSSYTETAHNNRKFEYLGEFLNKIEIALNPYSMA